MGYTDATPGPVSPRDRPSAGCRDRGVVLLHRHAGFLCFVSTSLRDWTDTMQPTKPSLSGGAPKYTKWVCYCSWHAPAGRRRRGLAPDAGIRLTVVLMLPAGRRHAMARQCVVLTPYHFAPLPCSWAGGATCRVSAKLAKLSVELFRTVSRTFLPFFFREAPVRPMR